MDHPVSFEVDDEFGIDPARDGRLADCGENSIGPSKALFYFGHASAAEGGRGDEWIGAKGLGCADQQLFGVGGGDLAKNPQQCAQDKSSSVHGGLLPNQSYPDPEAFRSSRTSNGSHFLSKAARVRGAVPALCDIATISC
ncbi:hypothetical protein NB231_16998 [Nitrococcus mobilis Nb-231]|uniref:Uncharacterized protein n=1 Tax=Nitrococcus mobilis Nb-231 TaxID=314278 RepID=A4BMK0_9GAMM|nr:hypothetical protein NB231_16998 [Nitrococcus mobilis Nb-231]